MKLLFGSHNQAAGVNTSWVPIPSDDPVAQASQPSHLRSKKTVEGKRLGILNFRDSEKVHQENRRRKGTWFTEEDHGLGNYIPQGLEINFKMWLLSLRVTQDHSLCKPRANRLITSKFPSCLQPLGWGNHSQPQMNAPGLALLQTWTLTLALSSPVTVMFQKAL